MGRQIIGQLTGGTSLGATARSIADRYAIPMEQATRDLNAFLGQLHAGRLVSIRQPQAAEAWLRCRQFATNLFFTILLRHWPGATIPPSRRYEPVPSQIVKGAVEAHVATVAMGALLAIAAAGVFAARNLAFGMSPLSPATIYILFVILAYSAGIGLSALLHELAHYWVCQQFGIRVRSVFVRIGVVGLSHERAAAWPTLVMSAAGPLTAVLTMGLLCLALLNLPIGSESSRLPLAFACLLIGAQHLPGLTPLTRDGRLVLHSVGKLLFSRASNR